MGNRESLDLLLALLIVAFAIKPNGLVTPARPAAAKAQPQSRDRQGSTLSAPPLNLFNALLEHIKFGDPFLFTLRRRK